MDMKQHIIANMDEITTTFEDRTGIQGLRFELAETKNYRKEVFYFLTAKIPSFALGVLSNNLKEVEVIISFAHVHDKNKIFYSADFQYTHKDSGSNGMSVMLADGSDRFLEGFELNA